MATANHTANPSRSTDTFKKIFDDAKADYVKKTGQRLEDHSFAQHLARCNDPETISALFESQTKAFNGISGNKMTTWGNTIVDILLNFSDAFGDVIGLVSNLLRPGVPSFNSRTCGSQTLSPGKMVLMGFSALLQVCPRHKSLIAHMCNAQTHTGRQRRLSH